MSESASRWFLPLDNYPDLLPGWDFLIFIVSPGRAPRANDLVLLLADDKPRVASVGRDSIPDGAKILGYVESFGMNDNQEGESL